MKKSNQPRDREEEVLGCGGKQYGNLFEARQIKTPAQGLRFNALWNTVHIQVHPPFRLPFATIYQTCLGRRWKPEGFANEHGNVFA